MRMPAQGESWLAVSQLKRALTQSAKQTGELKAQVGMLEAELEKSRSPAVSPPAGELKIVIVSHAQ